MAESIEHDLLESKRAVRLYVEPSFLVQMWYNTTHAEKVFTNSIFYDIIKVVRKPIDKLEYETRNPRSGL